MATFDKNLSRLPNLPDHALIGEASKIPVNAATPVISVSPIVLPAPDRIIDLHLRVSAPVTGTNLPIIILSHGQGSSNNLSSLNGYAPVVNFWAAHGFVVIQPNHLSSKTLNLGPGSAPDAPLFYKSRVLDLKDVLDRLDEIEAAFPQIQGRLDRSAIAVAGHSMGGHSASLLLGARTKDSSDGSEINLFDARIKAGVLLGTPGDGRDGEGLSEMAKENFQFLVAHAHAEMVTPTLVVIGDKDGFPKLTTRGAEWHADAYNFSKGPKSLLTAVGGKHILGGVSGYDASETDDESPERLAMVQRLSWAYLRSTLYPEDPAWSEACKAMEGLPGLGKVENK
ncbi:uncharacterized protein N7459_001310 [Penicillium hispanicum]|uniref:uncharacterized protein n=1 Tax=Penicillium hispanicum TaxID=1080232 RepID=UPI00253FBB04|nr:uncharacterized protein N7459_001310 [Penicillium hispanicum]KAJ5595102.1 hypothetical protein N7459_001310 [Penicillium hispanicum]